MVIFVADAVERVVPERDEAKQRTEEAIQGRRFEYAFVRKLVATGAEHALHHAVREQRGNQPVPGQHRPDKDSDAAGEDPEQYVTPGLQPALEIAALIQLH